MFGVAFIMTTVVAITKIALNLLRIAFFDQPGELAADTVGRHIRLQRVELLMKLVNLFLEQAAH